MSTTIEMNMSHRVTASTEQTNLDELSYSREPFDNPSYSGGGMTQIIWTRELVSFIGMKRRTHQELDRVRVGGCF